MADTVFSSLEDCKIRCGISNPDLVQEWCENINQGYRYVYTAEPKNPWTIRSASVWGKTTLITGGVGKAGMDSPLV